MNNEDHIPEDDLVLFALQFLPENEMRDARRHIETCDPCRVELARLQGDLVAYAMTAEVVAPPAEARERLLRQIAKEPRLAPASTEPVQTQAAKSKAQPAAAKTTEPTFAARQSRFLAEEPVEVRRPRRAPWVLAWTGWALAAGCSFVAGLELHRQQVMQRSMADQQARVEQSQQDAARAQDAMATLTAADARQVALHVAAPATKTGAAAPAASPEAMAAYLADKGALVFVATHLQAPGVGKTYELWLLPSDENKTPIPAGTFKPDAQGSASIVMPRIPKGVQAKGFGVTIENDGGSSTPTLPIVMSGT
jgi:hypothetical protein